MEKISCQYSNYTTSMLASTSDTESCTQNIYGLNIVFFYWDVLIENDDFNGKL